MARSGALASEVARGETRGRKKIAASVTSAVAESVRSSKRKPAAFTSGPSSQTASELTPNATVNRIPLTREREQSST